jgi:hypothetical protein
MKRKCPATVLTLPILAILATPAGAQMWCAFFDDGTKQCGFPSFESCQKTVSGVGGDCESEPSQTNRRARSGRDRLDSPLVLPDAPSGPDNPNWMPPPPNE